MNRKAIGIALFGVAAALCPARNAVADHPTAGFGHGAAGPIVTISASTLPVGVWSIAVRTEFFKLDPIPDPRLEELAAGGREVHSVDSVLSPFLGAAYGATGDLTLSFNIPYVVRKDLREGRLEDGAPEVHADGASKGIGDTTLLAEYRFLNRARTGLDASVLAGIKIPTGETNRRTSDGEPFETEHQPGSGSWDPMAGVAVTKRMNSWSFDAGILYTLATEGSRDTDLGDLLNVNASVSCRFGGEEGRHSHVEEEHAHHPPGEGPHSGHPHLALDLILEANGEWRAKQEIAGVRDQDSGGTVVYLSPGVRITAGERYWGYLSIGVPVHQDTNGIQHEVDYRVIAGLGASF